MWWLSTMFCTVLKSKINFSLISRCKAENKGVKYVFDSDIESLQVESAVLAFLNILSNLLTMELLPDRRAISSTAVPMFAKEFGDMLSPLGHISYDKTEHVKPHTDIENQYWCDVCNATKTTRNVSHCCYKKPLCRIYKLLHLDVGEMQIVFCDGVTCHALFDVGAHRYMSIVHLHKKSGIYRRFFELHENGPINISTLRSDQNAVYLISIVHSLCIVNDIRQEFSSGAVSGEMSAAERLYHSPL